LLDKLGMPKKLKLLGYILILEPSNFNEKFVAEAEIIGFWFN
jgi:hypothetical protein